MKKEIKINENLLEVRNLSKFFTTRYGINKAVDNVSFKVAKGEIIGLIGQSGSGKSTVGNALMRLLSEINGTITLDGKVVSGRISKKRKKEFNRNVQMIFQDPHTALNEKRNVFTTVAEPLVVNKIINKQVKEFLRDYKQILITFKYTLKKAYKQLSVEYDETRNAQRKEALLKTIEKLENYSFNEFGVGKIDLAFSELFFSYFEERTLAEEEILRSLITASDNILKLYELARHKTKTRDLPKDEVNYLDAQDALDNYIASFDDKEIDKKINLADKAIEKDIHEQHKEIKRLIVALVKDRKSKYKFQRQQGLMCSTKQEKHKHDLIMKRLRLELHALENFVSPYFVVDLEDIYELDNKIQNTHNFDQTVKEELARLNAITIEKRKVFEHVHTQEIEILSKNKGEHIKPDEKEVARLTNEITLAKKEYDRNAVEFAQQFEVVYKKLTDREQAAAEAQQEIIELEAKAKHLFDSRLAEIFATIDKIEQKAKLETIAKNEEKIKAKGVEAKMLIKQLNQFQYIMGLKDLPRFIGPIVRKRIARNFLLKKAVFDSLVQVGLKPEHAYRYPHEFSGGQKQRINIARALIMEPKLIVADEPIASLDVSIQAQVVNILIDLVRNKNISMIFIAHDLSIVEYLADSILVMHMGRVVEKGFADLIYKTPLHPYTQTLLAATPKISTANEPFKSADVDLGYLRDYAVDEPKMLKAEEHHFILANDSQFKKWTKKEPEKAVVSVPVKVVSDKKEEKEAKTVSPQKSKKAIPTKAAPIKKTSAPKKTSEKKVVAKQAVQSKVAKKTVVKAPAKKVVAEPGVEKKATKKPAAKTKVEVVKKPVDKVKKASPKKTAPKTTGKKTNK